MRQSACRVRNGLVNCTLHAVILVAYVSLFFLEYCIILHVLQYTDKNRLWFSKPWIYIYPLVLLMALPISSVNVRDLSYVGGGGQFSIFTSKWALFKF